MSITKAVTPAPVCWYPCPRVVERQRCAGRSGQGPRAVRAGCRWRGPGRSGTTASTRGSARTSATWAGVELGAEPVEHPPELVVDLTAVVLDVVRRRGGDATAGRRHEVAVGRAVVGPGRAGADQQAGRQRGCRQEGDDAAAKCGHPRILTAPGEPRERSAKVGTFTRRRREGFLPVASPLTTPSGPIRLGTGSQSTVRSGRQRRGSAAGCGPSGAGSTGRSAFRRLGRLHEAGNFHDLELAAGCPG